jgi:hypothetical protein
MAEATTYMSESQSNRLPPPPCMEDPSSNQPTLLPSNPHVRMLKSHLANLYTEIYTQQSEVIKTTSSINSLMTEARETGEELIEAQTRMGSEVDDEDRESDNTTEDEADDEDSEPVLDTAHRPRRGTVLHARYNSRVETCSPEVQEVSSETRQMSNRDTNLAQTVAWYARNDVGLDGVDQFGGLWMDYHSEADAERDDDTDSTGGSSDTLYDEDDDSRCQDWFY